MKLILCISFLFLLSCNVEEIEPQLVEEYFFNKEVPNPIDIPTISEIKGKYLVSRPIPADYKFYINELELFEAPNNQMYFSIPSYCQWSCPEFIPRLTKKNDIYLKLNGFDVIIPDQNAIIEENEQFKLLISNGKGSISRDKKTIKINYSMYELGRVQPLKLADFSYTFTKIK
jgi:hypothetical protein